MTVGRHSTKILALGLQQHSVEVVANVLLSHGKVSLVDQATKFTLLEIECLLRIDVIDQREFRGRKRGKRKSALPRAQRRAFPFRAQRDVRFLGKRTKDIEQFASGNSDVS